MIYRVLIFAEGDFEGVRKYDDQSNADAFAAGYGEGADKYGGSGVAFVIPGDEEELEEYAQRHAEEVARARKAIEPVPLKSEESADRHGHNG